MTLAIRPMQDSDVESVYLIECNSTPFPWKKLHFAECLLAGYECQVMVIGSRVVGFAIATVKKPDAELLNICIDPKFQHQGNGSILLNYLIELGKVKNLQHIFLEVRMSNATAQNLYRKFLFNEISVRPNYYPAKNGREDALLMVRALKF